MSKVGYAAACIAAVLAAVPVAAIAQAEKPGPAADCETRMQALDASNAEGEERFAEKNGVIALCGRQYARDTTIQRLVKECAKYVAQPVVKQQFAADCMLAAFGYANALRTLKSEYRK